MVKPTKGAKKFEGSKADERQDNAGQRKLDAAAAKKKAPAKRKK